MNHSFISGALLLVATVSTNLSAQTLEVKDAWVRATVQGQKATGAFMTLTAKSSGTLVSVSSPVAGVAEVHEMKLDGQVMKMRALSGGLDLPAGKPVTLGPGNYHIMLMDLKLPLKTNTTIPMTLSFRDAKGVESKIELKVPVSQYAPANSRASEPVNHEASGGHQH